MWHTIVSFGVNLVSFICLAYLLAQAKHTGSKHLLGYLLVLGLMLSTSVAKFMSNPHSPALDAYDLVSSLASTWILACTALYLIDRRALPLKIGFLIAIAIRGYGFLTNADESDLHVYQAIDSGLCLVAGTLFAVGLSSKFENRYLFAGAFLGPLVWGASDLTYWLNESSYLNMAGNWIAIISTAATSIFAGLLALRESPPPDDPPNTTEPVLVSP